MEEASPVVAGKCRRRVSVELPPEVLGIVLDFCVPLELSTRGVCRRWRDRWVKDRGLEEWEVLCRRLPAGFKGRFARQRTAWAFCRAKARRCCVCRGKYRGQFDKTFGIFAHARCVQAHLVSKAQIYRGYGVRYSDLEAYAEEADVKWRPLFSGNKALRRPIEGVLPTDTVDVFVETVASRSPALKSILEDITKRKRAATTKLLFFFENNNNNNNKDTTTAAAHPTPPGTLQVNTIKCIQTLCCPPPPPRADDKSAAEIRHTWVLSMMMPLLTTPVHTRDVWVGGFVAFLIKHVASVNALPTTTACDAAAKKTSTPEPPPLAVY